MRLYIPFAICFAVNIASAIYLRPLWRDLFNIKSHA